MFIKFLSFFFVLSTALFSHQYDVSIMSVFRDEAPYLKEWIEFHRMVGVEHFYLANHLSQDNYLEILQPYIDAGLVDLVHLTESYEVDDPKRWYKWNNIQSRYCTTILQKKQKETKWLIALDIDEFLVPYDTKNLRDFLQDYEEFGGVSVFWKNYGTSFIDKIPSDQLMIETLTLRAEDEYDWNRYFKTFIMTEKTLYYSQPHWPTFQKGYFSVAANKKRIIKSPEDFHCYEKIAIHHFWTKDEDFFTRVKLGRRAAWSDIQEVLTRKEKCNGVQDLCLLPLAENLKNIINNKNHSCRSFDYYSVDD